VINSPPLIWVRNLFRKFLPEIIGAVCLLFIWTLEHYRHFIFFKDYGIIWEAAYRIYLGQIPFFDFSTPVGPGSFLIPALFFKALGPSWNSLQLAQLIQSSILLLSAYFILKKTAVRELNLGISIFVFTFLYLIFLSHPWYNSTAILFLFISLSFTLTKNHYSFFIAGFFSGISFLTKQDVGILNLISLGLIALVIDRKCLTHHSRAFNFIQCIFGMLLVISGFAFIIGISSFHVWMERSFILSLSRNNSLGDLVSGLPILILGVLCLKQSLTAKENFLPYATVLYFCAFVGIQTKALFFTNYFYVLFLYPTFSYFLKRNLKLTIFFVAPTILMSIVNPVASLKNLAQTTILGAPEPFRFKHSLVTKTVIPAPQDIKSLHKILAPPETFEAINIIKGISKKYSELGQTPSLLNISEITPIYYEANIPPLKDISLWFDPKLRIPRHEEELIQHRIISTEFDIIVFQTTYADQSANGYIQYRFYETLLKLIQENKSYHQILEDGFYSPDSSIHGCSSKKSCFNHMLFVFVRTDERPK